MTTTLTPANSTDNPFFAPSDLPFGVPPFDRIRDAHYLKPAIRRGMRQHLAEVAAIANQTSAPTFDNTLVALERTGILLTRVLRAFAAVTGANTNDTLQVFCAEVDRSSLKLPAAHSDAIFLDDALFQRVRAIYEGRHSQELSAEDCRLIERYHLDFARAGALLSDPDTRSQLRSAQPAKSRR